MEGSMLKSQMGTKISYKKRSFVDNCNKAIMTLNNRFNEQAAELLIFDNGSTIFAVLNEVLFQDMMELEAFEILVAI